MSERLYLLWIPDGWGVYRPSSCPDPGAFPKYFFREYEFPSDEWGVNFQKLLIWKDHLDREGILPTEDNYEEIFRDLSDIPG